MADVNDLVDQWLQLDKDPATRSEIERLLADNNVEELEQRLSTRLAFGTAGLRAQMGAGFARLNSLTIIQTSQGLAEHLLSTLPQTAGAGIVVGHDARHNSEHFAQLTAAVFENKGITVWWYEDVVHTPLVPFAASHNPAQDNGYKVYGSNGCQINSPEDTTVKLFGMESGMTVVDQQAQPDPDFPTVKYPNPEEKGALNLAISTADEKNVSLILANDPDADRFAVAEKVGNVWHQFTGDQVGILLAYWIFSSNSSQMHSDDIMLTTAVSSQMLSYIADAEGFGVCETLTGFKWLGNVAQYLQKKGKRVHFAYEEALGYMFPSIVSDKDGISAAVMFLTACSVWSSPWVQLQALYEKYGYFETTNTYWRSSSVQKTRSTFEAVRKCEQPFPSYVGYRKVVRWRDLTTGYDSATDDSTPVLPTSASTQMITCWLNGSESDDGIRFTVRTSGTEPKIKLYLECRSKNQDSARKGALGVLGWLKGTWFNDTTLKIEDRFADT
ncbi:MAG: hypothetical protein Q9213_001662 [Squamulea squamosa]